MGTESRNMPKVSTREVEFKCQSWRVNQGHRPEMKPEIKKVRREQGLELEQTVDVVRCMYCVLKAKHML